MTRDEALIEVQNMINAARQLSEVIAGKISQWANTIDPEKLSPKEAEELAKLLRRLRKAGALRTH